MLFFFFGVFSFSLVKLCITDNVTAAIETTKYDKTCLENNTLNPDDPFSSAAFYEQLAKLIDRDDEVELDFIRKEYQTTQNYVPTLKIEPFHYKTVKLRKAYNNLEPSSINFTYSKNADLSLLKIDSIYNIILKGDSDDIPIEMTEWTFSSGKKMSFDPKPRKATLIYNKNSVDVSKYSDFTDFNIKSLDFTIKVGYAAYIFNFTKDKIFYSEPGKQRTALNFMKNANLLLSAEDEYSDIFFIGSGIEYSSLPNLKISDNYIRLTFLGYWPPNPPRSFCFGSKDTYNTIDVTTNTTSPIPFDFIGKGISIKPLVNTNFTGNLTINQQSPYNANIAIKTNQSEILKLNLKYVRAPQIYFFNSSIDVTIEHMDFDHLTMKGKFLVNTVLTKYGIPTLSILSMNVDKSYLPTNLLVHLSDFGDDLGTEKLYEIFNNKGFFLRLPKQKCFEEDFMLEYDGTTRAGFKNDDSWIGFKKMIDQTGSLILFEYYWVKDPGEIPFEIVLSAEEVYHYLGPEVDLKDIVEKYPSAKFIDFKLLPGDKNEIHIFSTIDLPLDNYQFCFKFGENSDTVKLSLEMENITKSFLCLSFIGLEIETPFNIKSQTIKIENTIFKDYKSVNLDTENLEIDAISLQYFSYPIPKIKNFIVGTNKINNGIMIHETNLTINNATIPFDAEHNISFICSTGIDIKCNTNISELNNFYGFNFYPLIPAESGTLNVRIMNFPKIQNIVKPIAFVHDQAGTLKISISSKTDVNILEVAGKGRYVISSDYGDKKAICVCEKDDCSQHDPNSCSSNDSASFSNLQAKINQLNFNDIDILVFSATSTDYPTIQLKTLEGKKISFIANENNFNIGLDNSDKMLDPHSSHLIIGEHCQKLILINKGTEGENIVELGKLEIKSAELTFEGFLNIDFITGSLELLPSNIKCFKSISIKEKLTLKRKTINDEDWSGKVNFIGKYDGERLSLDDSFFKKNLTFGNEKLTIGSDLVFNIPKQDINSVTFTLVKISTVIKCEPNTDITKIPKTSIIGGTTDTFNFEFEGEWPEATESVILIQCKEELTLSLSTIIPVYIDFIGKLVKFHAQNINVGIIGGKMYYENQQFDAYSIEFDSTILDETVKFIFESPLVIKFFYGSYDADTVVKLKFNSATIQTIFNGFRATDRYDDELEPGDEDPIKMNFQISMSNNFINSVSFEKSDYPVTLEEISFVSEIIKGNENIDEMPIIKNGFLPFLIGPKEILNTFDFESLRFENIAKKGEQLFGFLTEDNIVSFRYSDTSPSSPIPSLQIYTTMNIWDKPYIVQIMSSDDLKMDKAVSYVVGPDYSSKLKEEIKYSQLRYITFYFSTDVKEENIDFSIIDSLFDHNISYVFDGLSLNMKIIHPILGKKTSELTIKNINYKKIIQSSSSKSLLETTQINSITISNSIFEEGSLNFDDKIKSLKITINSYNVMNEQHLLEQYNNEIIFTRANIITFTKTGWEIAEIQGLYYLEIVKSSMKNKILFESVDVSRLLLKEPGIMSEVNLIPIKITNADYVTLGRGWNLIKNANKLNISLNTRIKLYSSSYPIQNIFDKDNWIFSFDDKSSSISVGLYDDYVFDESVNFDLTPVSLEYPNIPGNTIFFENSPTISFKDDFGYLNVQKVIVKNLSTPSIGTISINESIEMIENSQCLIDIIQSTKIILSWNYANFPHISLSEKTEIDSNIIIHYNGLPEINNKTYNEVLKNLKRDLIEGDFNCENYIKSLKFDSKIPEFSNMPNSGIFNLSCSNKASNRKSLTIEVIRELPTDGDITPTVTTSSSSSDDDDSDSKDKDVIPVGGIIGIVLSCVVVVGIVTGVVVYICTRKKYERLMVSTSTIDSVDIHESQSNAPPNED